MSLIRKKRAPYIKKEFKIKPLKKGEEMPLIYLKQTSDIFTGYSIKKMMSMYKDYCKNYRSLKCFAENNSITVESAEVLIKTMRKYSNSIDV